MYTKKFNIQQIVPFHEVRDEEKLGALTQSMNENGWQGRHIVGFDLGDEFRAITGSHRLQAADDAGIEELEVACVEYGTMFEDYDITTDDLKDPSQIYRMLDEYDKDAAELFSEDVD
ncbi:MAG: ParB N-terminal domain-containing protein [Caldisericia bacterium]|nr:ParB N-terminal domain-containing protein [Caldisericia bacterium]